MFSKPLFMLPTRTTDGSEERDDFPCFELKFDFLKRFSKKPLTLTSTGSIEPYSKDELEQENTRERERILGRWPGYVNFTKVIFRGCNRTEV